MLSVTSSPCATRVQSRARTASHRLAFSSTYRVLFSVLARRFTNTSTSHARPLRPRPFTGMRSSTALEDAWRKTRTCARVAELMASTRYRLALHGRRYPRFTLPRHRFICLRTYSLSPAFGSLSKSASSSTPKKS